jgi:HK97 family phage prohead protease
MAVTKSEPDGRHPASHYLVVEDPEKPTTWHLRYRDTNGKPDARLMGACYAALTSNYRGNPYGGPNKQEALTKLRSVYKEAGMTWPGDSKAAEQDPEMEYKSLPFHAISPTEMELNEDEFAGYAATWDFDGRDVIGKGAFAHYLPEYKAAGVICWQHDWKEPIGKPLEAKEDEKGLFVRGKISRTSKGSDALVLLRDGVVDKLSIGFKATKARILSDTEGKSLLGEQPYLEAKEGLPWDRSGIRFVEQMRLYEVSPVTVPQNYRTSIIGVKSGLPAGLTFDDHFSAVLATNEEFAGRFRDLADLRIKAGRTLSATNVSKLSDVRDRIMAQLQVIDDLLDSVLPDDAGEPDNKAADEALELKRLALREVARFQRTLAHLNGAA